MSLSSASRDPKRLADAIRSLVPGEAEGLAAVLADQFENLEHYFIIGDCISRVLREKQVSYQEVDCIAPMDVWLNKIYRISLPVEKASSPLDWGVWVAYRVRVKNPRLGKALHLPARPRTRELVSVSDIEREVTSRYYSQVENELPADKKRPFHVSPTFVTYLVSPTPGREYKGCNVNIASIVVKNWYQVDSKRKSTSAMAGE